MATPSSSSVVVASASSACPSPLLPAPRSLTSCHCRRRRSGLSCRASSDDPRFDRRDVLAGITGFAASGGLGTYRDLAFAAGDGVEFCPKGSTFLGDKLKCDPRKDEVNPCLEKKNSPVDFKPPEGRICMRRAVHLADDTLVQKYRDAVAKMKALDDSDPRSFRSQSSIHQAYCDGHYMYTAAAEQKDAPFDVHFSWIFAPWHRMYIYFYERILGSLIGDPDFRLPYWNWDARAGMSLPAIFKDPTYIPFGKNSLAANPLHDCNRNPKHLDSYVALDLKQDSDLTIPFKPNDSDDTRKFNEVVKDNLATLHAQMIRQGRGARCFLGEKLCTGLSVDRTTQTAGSLERMAHTAVHVWVGRSESDKDCKSNPEKDQYCSADMGFLGTASRDPVFYSHHSNVDRMWHLWDKELGGKNFTDREWLDTSFLFYDENKQLVRIKVSDVLDVGKLGYGYDDSPPKLWKLRPPLQKYSKPKPDQAIPSAPVPVVDFPQELKTKLLVPGVARAPGLKEKGKQEALLFDAIEFDPRKLAKFVVVVNVEPKEAGGVGPRSCNLAGSFVSMPRNTNRETIVCGLQLPLEDLLIDLGVPDGEPINVVLVPLTQGITIKSAPRIKFSDC